MDGEGYPTGLRGGEIPLEARILFVADALEIGGAAGDLGTAEADRVDLDQGAAQHHHA